MAFMERFTQVAFRYRDDDGSESAATWRQNINTNDTLTIDTTYRMRIGVQGTHVGSGSSDLVAGFQYNVDAAGWNNITTSSSNVKAVASADTSWTINDDDSTTEQLAQSQTFVAGKMDETGTCTAVSISETEESEWELVFQLVSPLAGGEAVQIKIVDSGSDLFAYTLTPSITAAAAGGGPAEEVNPIMATRSTP